jgi:magnesium chelatase family protein
MIARAHTFTADGPHVERVTVEVELRRGLPAFVVVGLADAAVREARERVRAAIRNCGFDFPSGRITANLAPADVPKAGPGLDLGLACAVLHGDLCTGASVVRRPRRQAPDRGLLDRPPRRRAR